MHIFEAIGIALILYSLWTLFIYASVVRAMVIERKQEHTVFYTIYMAGSVADIVALVNVVITYCSLTDFLHFQFLRTTIALRISHIIVWGTRFNQLLTALLIALNRLTAIHSIKRHKLIWTRKSAQVCAFFQITSIFVYGTMVTQVLKPVWAESSFGGVVAEFSIRTEDLMLHLSLLIQLLINLAIIISYVAILLGVRSAMSKPRLPQNKIRPRNEAGLHSITLIICTLEILNLVQHILSNELCSKTNETKTSIYIMMSVVNNSIPPYLIIAFSKCIRHQILSWHNPLMLQSGQLFTTKVRETRVVPI